MPMTYFLRMIISARKPARFSWIVICTIFISTGFLKTIAQNADFVAFDEYCINSNIYTQNATIDGAKFQWDFCAGEFYNAPDDVSVGTFTGINNVRSSTLIYDSLSEKYLLFATDNGTHKLYRFVFYQGLNSGPVKEDITFASGSLLNPEDIEIVKNSDGNYYGFIGSSSTTAGIRRVSFGESLLENNLHVTNLGTFGQGSTQMRDLKIVKENGNFILLVLDLGNEQFIRMNYGSSITNTPLSTTPTTPMTDLVNASGFDLINYSGDWIAIVSGLNTNNLVRVNFGTSILNPYVKEKVINSPAFNRPARVKIINTPEGYFLIIPQLTGDTHVFSMSSFDINEPVDILPYTVRQLEDVSGDYYLGQYLFFGFDGNDLRRLIFHSTCDATVSFSEEFDLVLKYQSAGSYPVNLRVYDQFGALTFKADTIAVSSLVAPDIDFSMENQCVFNDIILTSLNQSGDIQDYSWNFGDLNSASTQHAVHQYADPGDYVIQLTVTANNGCVTERRQNLTVFSEPISSFTSPSTTPLCTNQPYLFFNSTDFDPGSNPSWQWLVNDVPLTTEEDLEYAFADDSPHEIKLIASIPGCSSEHSEVINSIAQGPSVNFSFDGQCQDELIAFSNLTTGPADTFDWDFGDGAISFDLNPDHAYDEIGNYSVTLTVSNAAGCSNFKTQTLSIYSRPQPDLSVDLPPFSCNGMPTQLNDLTPQPIDSNIDTWLWDFGDATSSSNTSDLQNPTHTYALAGDYPVTLTVTTEFGCTNSTMETITISQAPSSDFTFLQACVNLPTVFSGPTDPAIVSRNWQIGTSMYTSPSPIHQFSSSGNFTARLTVTATNGCESMTIKTVSVPVPPTMDFSYEKNCVNTTATFTSLATSPSDPIQNQSWLFNGVTTASGPTVSHTFSSAGSFPVKLTVNTLSGCTYPFQKNVPVVPAPVASFEVPYDRGAPPFTVDFMNTSSNASVFLWEFGDNQNTTSSAVSPEFTYPSTGEYLASLTASNTQGCTDEAELPLYVMLPSHDVAVQNVRYLQQPGGPLVISADIVNNGNLPVLNIPIDLNLVTATINELFNGFILPGQQVTHQFTTTLVPTVALNYLCVEVPLTGDLNPNNNKACIAMDDPVTFYPYPNPASERLYVQWIAPDDNPVSIKFLAPDGKELLAVNLPGKSGLNSYMIDTASLESGIYLLEWKSGSIQRTRRVVIQN